MVVDDRVPCRNEETETVHVFDFNYVCLTVEEDDGPQFRQLALRDDIVFNCQYEADIRKGLRLYHVLNYKAILYDKRKRDELLDWMMEKSRKPGQQETRTTRTRKTGEFDEIGLLR